MLHNTKNKFIVMEGISGSGKTELGLKLANQISAKYYKTPPDIFGKIREEADKNLCLESRFLFYLSSVMQASLEISEILKTQSVVCDKYIWSTICYHTVFGLNIKFPVYLNYINPDYAFLVVCEENKRLERLLSRCGHPKNKDEYSFRQQMERKCLIEFRKYLPLEIDNTIDGPQNAIDEILSIILEK